MFFGRKRELDVLQECYESDKAEFIVVYGRRRIGKTALLREFCKGKPHVLYSAVQTTDDIQLTRWSEMIIEEDAVGDRFSDWERAFTYLVNKGEQAEKKVVVIDEFPYMVQGNASVPSILQTVWDHQLNSGNIMIVICGSSMSFMEKEVLSEKNPLYGRTTGVLKVTELSFHEAKAFMPNADMVEQMQYYSVFSGVPYYLGLIDVGKSFRDNVTINILRNGSALFNEVEFLLKQELREIANYNAIIESIALGYVKSNEIAQRVGIVQTKLPYYLKGLMELGIIRREYPVTMSTRERSKSKSGLYKIDNSFFRFYYAFVYPYISEIQDGNEEAVLEDVIIERLPMFVSKDYKDVAVSYVRNMSLRGGLPFRAIRVGRWWYKDNEIDVVAHDLKGNYLFGECKWRNEKMGIQVLEKLKEKSKNVSTDVKRSSYILFSKSGFTNELTRYSEKSQEVILVADISID